VKLHYYQHEQQIEVAECPETDARLVARGFHKIERETYIGAWHDHDMDALDRLADDNAAELARELGAAEKDKRKR
jgi:hypothetical protein